jgi:PKD repeat protein
MGGPYYGFINNQYCVYYTASILAVDPGNSTVNNSTVVPTPVPQPSIILPVAAFTSSNPSGYNKLTVNFKDNSTRATYYKWDFGDKSTSTVNTYSKVGNYTVTLTVKNKNGTDNITRTDYVSVVLLKAPIAGLTAKVSGRVAQFTDITLRVWSFGDKTTSTELNPIHKYTKAGKYTVTLTVSNATGKSSKTATVIIK